FDVRNMSGLKEKAAELAHPFTVDSANSFDMGKAAGRFGYVEDPDGALIEFVETHKIPIVEQWSWYIDLKKRNPNKSLPRWLINCFRFNRVKHSSFSSLRSTVGFFLSHSLITAFRPMVRVITSLRKSIPRAGEYSRP